MDNIYCIAHLTNTLHYWLNLKPTVQPNSYRVLITFDVYDFDLI